MNYSEKIAKRILQAILPGASVVYRQTQSHGEYDFDLRYNDGTDAAVEVTSAVDEVLMNTVGAIRGKRAGGSVLKAVICQKSWVVFPTKGASIKTIRANIDRELATLEQEGIDRFYCVSKFASVQKVCCSLQITGGGAIRSEGEPTIRIAYPIGGGAVGPSVATKAGESEAWKQDNRRKLEAAKTTERHLVVYIDVSNGLAWTALTNFAPPSSSPNLPPEITTLWLIGHSEKKDECIVWSASANQTWRSITVTCESGA